MFKLVLMLFNHFMAILLKILIDDEYEKTEDEVDIMSVEDDRLVYIIYRLVYVIYRLV